MKSTLKGKSLLTLKDWTPEEVRDVLDLSHKVKKERKSREAAAEIPGADHRAAFREALHADALRLRDGVRGGRGAPRVPLHRGHPPRREGSNRRHRAGPGQDVRRNPVPRLQAVHRGNSGPVVRSAGVQRPHRRMASDPGARGPHDHGRRVRQPEGNEACVRGGWEKQRCHDAPGRLRPDGRARLHRLSRHPFLLRPRTSNGPRPWERTPERRSR